MQGAYADPYYVGQRQQLFLVAVNCQSSTETCFCVSTGDGPEAHFGYDLLLDELEDGFLVEAKSEAGEAIFNQLPLQETQPKQLEQAANQIQIAAKQQRRMPSEAELQKLMDKLDDQRWHQIAERCLACGNCTSVCPTCFCSKQESESNVLGIKQNVDEAQSIASQVRLWDSCFSEKHSYIHGKTVRSEISQQYRQWLIHKLLTWQTQYGRSGCVGCGRCIAWCPVGIDLVEEANLLVSNAADDSGGEI